MASMRARAPAAMGRSEPIMTTLIETGREQVLEQGALPRAEVVAALRDELCRPAPASSNPAVPPSGV